jgi:hypothetical protein
MSCVAKDMRGVANGFAMFSQLMLGGLPAPYVVAILGQTFNLQFAMIILMLTLSVGGTLSALVWFWTNREVNNYRFDVSLDEKRDIKLID